MPPRGLSNLVDSDMEDISTVADENTMLSIERESASPEPAKGKAGRTKVSKNRVTKPKTATSKKETGGAAKRARKTAAPKRKALEEQVNEQLRATDTSHAGKAKTNATQDTVMSEDVSSDDELDSPKTLAQEKKTTDARPKDQRVAKKGSKPVAASRKREKPAQPSTATKIEDISKAIPETQQDFTGPENHPASNSHTFFRTSINGGARFDRPSRNDPSFHHRAGSASDSERNSGDPQLRRKLGDMTRKFESIELKYRNLRETGIVEANANVDKLKKQCEATSLASNELVASLKKELAMQTSMAQEYRKLQKAMQARDAENSKLLSNISELTSSLSAAQNEVKALQAKLAAARTVATTVESTSGRTPGSAMKPSVPTRTVMVGSAEAAQAAQNAQLKEDLYSDLTGLILRGVKRTEDEDTFDCIQTGRNGTLHFKLIVAHDDNGKTTSFEETEFLYMPLLDSNRDRGLIELLPDYLTEDITFSRQHAAKFYSRVVDTLTKRAEE